MPHVIDKGDNNVICLTASHILSIVVYEKELSLFYSFSIRLHCTVDQELCGRPYCAFSRQVAVEFISGSIYPIRDREKLTSACKVSIKDV